MKNLFLLLIAATFAMEEKTSKDEKLQLFLKNQSDQLKMFMDIMKLSETNVMNLEALVEYNYQIRKLAKDANKILTKEQTHERRKKTLRDKMEEYSEGFLDRDDEQKFVLVQNRKNAQPNDISQKLEEPGKCAICQELIDDIKEKFISDCAHTYHFQCMKGWNDTCPVCRSKIEDVNVWITYENFLGTDNRPKPLADEIGDDRLEEHEEQILIGNIHEEGQHQVYLGEPLINGQQVAQNERCFHMCYWEFYMFWSVVEIVILAARTIPKWDHWFIRAQILNGLSLGVALILPCIVDRASSPFKKRCWMYFPGVLSGLSAVLAYESLLSISTLSVMNIAHASFWPYFTIFFGVLFYDFVTKPHSWRDPAWYLFEPPQKKYYTSGSIWFVLQIAIICARIFLEKWAVWFKWLQGVHTATLIALVVSKFISNNMGKWRSLIYVNVFNVIIGIMTYNSIGHVIFNPRDIPYLNKWSSAEVNYFLWFWILSFFRFFAFLFDLPPIENPWEPSYHTQCVLCLSWFVVQIGIIVAKILLPTWSGWYSFLQVGLGLSFLLFVLQKISAVKDFGIVVFGNSLYKQSVIHFVVISIFSYFSIGGMDELSAIEKAHYFLWPIFLAIYMFNRYNPDGMRTSILWQPCNRAKSALSLLWVFVQIGITSAWIIVPQWADWYGFMCGFQLLSLLLLVMWKYAARGEDFVVARNFVILTAILSYHSVLYFVFSDGTTGEFETSNFINAIVWPWVAFFLGLAMYCLKYLNH